MSDPVEVLKFLQKEIVTGRQLEVTNCDETIEGETNYITVDRDRILQTTFSELQYITNYRLTFQVDFMGEECVDQGGPRKVSRSQCRRHGVLCTGVRQVNHSEVHGKGSKTNAFIRIRLSRLFTILAVKTKKNTIV